MALHAARSGPWAEAGAGRVRGTGAQAPARPPAEAASQRRVPWLPFPRGLVAAPPRLALALGLFPLSPGITANSSLIP